MAITAFTGPPGSGKSHALVKDVIIPAVLAGRRVLSNIDGLNPDAIAAYCLERTDDASKLGLVECFHGEQATKPGFWPDENTSPDATIVKGGDLVVFDEWALYFPRRGNWPQGCNVEAFLRWHRHLTGLGGQATDICIGTQLATDIHQNVRGLIVKSYKFQKLTALGADGSYTWRLFEGHLQPKGGHYKNGTGKYDPEIFPLYASSAAAREGKHVELRTNKKDSIWSGATAWVAVIAPVVLFLAGGLGLWWVWGGDDEAELSPAVAAGPVSAGAAHAPPPRPAKAEWRIVGYVQGEMGTRVIVSDSSGAVRVLTPQDFEFEEGRPVSGLVDGQRAVAEERLPTSGASSSPFGGLLQ